MGSSGEKGGLPGKEGKSSSYVIRFPFTGTPPPPGAKLLDRYPLINPYAYAAIMEDENGSRKYYLDEVSLSPSEARVYSYILDKLETELTVPRTEVDPRKYFADQAKRIVEKYGIKVPPLPWAKIIYFAERDLVGFGVLDALLKDPNIEDISVDGMDKPVFVYHRRYESLGSNVVFKKDVDIDNLNTRLAHMAGKHISTAFPILQGTLPGRLWLMATCRREISPFGSTLTIRKFREDPLTIIDLLNSKVIDHKMAAYFWLMMENKKTALVVGSSVDWKTPLIFRRNGEIKIAETGKVIDAYFRPEEEGRVYASDIEAFCFDQKTLETKWQPIQYVYRHHGNGKLLRFRLQTGREIAVTRDHSIFVLRNGRVTSVHASEMNIGDFVVAPKSVTPGNRRVRKLDLVSLLADSPNGVFLYDVPAGVFDRLTQVPSMARRDWKHNRRLPLRYASLLRPSERRKVKVGYKGSKLRWSPTLTVDADFARILGYYIAEGNLIHRPELQYGVCFTLGMKDERIVRDIEAFAKEMGLNARRRKHRGNSFRMHISDRILEEVLERCSKTGARRKSVPNVILNSPSGVRRAFLEAWALGDGGSTSSRELMNGILYLLLLEGSLGSVMFKPGKGKVVIEGREVNANDSHQLRFPRPESLTGQHPRYKRKIRDPGYPVSLLPPELKRMSIERRQIVGNPSRGQRLTRRSLALMRERVEDLLAYSGTPLKTGNEAIHDGFYRSNLKYYEKAGGKLSTNQELFALSEKLEGVERMAQSNLAFLKVIGIEEVDSTSKYVYDLSVPGCENFLAGFGGVFCHNTGSGKTTLLNALLTLTRTNSKIVTIEEVQEVNIPHFNWTALISRENYGQTGEISSQVTLFDRVKAAMRMRPDIIVVGEVRGEEAYVLFQAISTGHGGASTVHADDVESAVQRLTSKPMDVPPAFIPFLDLTFTVRRISIPAPGGGFRAIRRIVSVDEVMGVGQYFNVFRWNPVNDSYKVAELRGSPKLGKLSRDLGMHVADMADELNRRSIILRWLQERKIRNFREVSATLEDYAARPAPVFQQAVRELGLGASPEAIAAEGFRL